MPASMLFISFALTDPVWRLSVQSKLQAFVVSDTALILTLQCQMPLKFTLKVSATSHQIIKFMSWIRFWVNISQLSEKIW